MKQLWTGGWGMLMVCLVAMAAIARDRTELVVIQSVPSSEEIVALLGTEPVETAALAVRIRFDRDSLLPSDEALEILSNLGNALSSPLLSRYRFHIEAHTDAVGSSAMNQELTERRARGLREFLISGFDIEPERLSSAGRGHDSPIRPDHPESPDNRVVVVTNLGLINP